MTEWLWLALLAALLCAGLVADRPGLVWLVVALGGGAALSTLWQRYSLRALTIERHVDSERLFFGEETQLRLTVTNAKPLPLPWLLVRDHLPAGLDVGEKGSAAPGRAATGALSFALSVGWYQRVTRTWSLRGTRRGHHTIGPAELEAGDLFGFGRSRLRDGQRHKVIVFPPVFRLPDLGLPPHWPVPELPGPRPLTHDPHRFASVRDYVPGDNPRFIHWKASAHHRTLQTKLFEPGATLLLTIALDVQTADQVYHQRPDYLEYMVSAVASLALQTLEDRHMVGLCANCFGLDGEPWTRLPPRRHRRQAADLLCKLAAVDAMRSMSFADMLHALMPLLPAYSTVVIVASRLTDASREAVLDLQGAGHGVAALWVGDELAIDGLTGLRVHHIGGQDAWERLVTKTA